LSELSNTISAYALITAWPAPSCRSFCRSSARSELKMSESTKRIAWNRLDLPEPFAPTAGRGVRACEDVGAEGGKTRGGCGSRTRRGSQI